MKGSSIDFLGKLISNLVGPMGPMDIPTKTAESNVVSEKAWKFDVWKKNMSFWDDSFSDAMAISRKLKCFELN